MLFEPVLYLHIPTVLRQCHVALTLYLYSAGDPNTRPVGLSLEARGPHMTVFVLFFYFLDKYVFKGILTQIFSVVVFSCVKLEGQALKCLEKVVQSASVP